MTIGRVSQSQLTSMLLGNIQSQLTEQNNLFEQISSNKRILRPSDDPAGTATAMGLQGQLDRLGDYGKEVATGQVWTNTTNTALTDANSTWSRVNEIAVSAADGTQTASDRAGAAQEIDQLLQHMVQTANTTQNGQYVFGGGTTDKPPFKAETDPNTGEITGVFYQGDDQTRSVQTQDQGSVPINVLGSNAGNPNQQGAFIDSKTNANLFNTMIQLRNKLQNNDTTGISGTGGVLAQVDQVAQNLTAAQTRVGSSQQVLTLDNNNITTQNSAVEGSLSSVENADVPSLVLELNNAQNTYQAALAAGGRLLQTGLINYI